MTTSLHQENKKAYTPTAAIASADAGGSAQAQKAHTLQDFLTSDKNNLSEALTPKQRKRAKRQRRRAREKAAKQQVQSMSPKPQSSTEAEIFQVVRPDLIASVISLHRYLRSKGAGGYLVAVDGFSIDGSALSKSEQSEAIAMLREVV